MNVNPGWPRQQVSTFRRLSWPAQFAKEAKLVQSLFMTSYIHFATPPNGQAAAILVRTTLSGNRETNGLVSS